MLEFDQWALTVVKTVLKMTSLTLNINITDTSLVYLSLASLSLVDLVSLLSLSFVSLCLSLVLSWGHPKFVGISLCRFVVLGSTFCLLHMNM